MSAIDLRRRSFIFGAAAKLIVPVPKTFHFLRAAPRFIMGVDLAAGEDSGTIVWGYTFNDTMRILGVNEIIDGVYTFAFLQPLVPHLPPP